MKSFLVWVQANPQAFKSFLMAFFAMLFKLTLQITGKSDQLDHWNDAVNQVIDMIVYVIGAYGVIAGSVHASRGPAPTVTDQAQAVVVAMKGTGESKP